MTSRIVPPLDACSNTQFVVALVGATLFDCGNSYSPSGDVTAPLVYANYGRPEDFRELEGMGVSVDGAIVIVRYG